MEWFHKLVFFHIVHIVCVSYGHDVWREDGLIPAVDGHVFNRVLQTLLLDWYSCRPFLAKHAMEDFLSAFEG